jgi:UDP-3-O-[3-hydroxymyristoyl] glucosamine N-acyltransferase
VAPLETATAESLVFVREQNFLPALAQSAAAAVVLKPEWADATDKPCLFSDNPYATFCQAVELLRPYAWPQTPSIHPTALIHPTARLGEGCVIGPYVVIEAEVEIGDQVAIGSHSFVGYRARIGCGSMLWPQVVIGDHCEIGSDCRLQSGVVIGGDGFGYLPQDQGFQRVPQVGRVIIGQRVDIGANTTIDRGGLGDTCIGDDVKLDNLIQIGHHVQIGHGTIMAACVGVSGSTTIGAQCRIGGGVGINGHIHIADRVQITGMTMVTKSLTAVGESYSSGSSAEPSSQWRKNAVRLRHLDAMARRLQALEKDLAQIKETHFGTDADI